MPELFDLKGKTAIVTGGGTGLGRAMALALADAGASVALAARRREPLEATAEEVRRRGGEAAVAGLDLTDEGSVARAVAEMEAALGPADILVNNSGISGEGWATDLPAEQWDRVVSTNLRGAFLMCQAVGRGMVARRSGAVVNVASVAGMIGIRMLSAYCASKGGLIQLTKALALEWARSGVRVNALAPGYILTDLNQAFFSTEAGERMIESHIPMGRLGRPEELAGAIVYLASDASGFMTGATLVVDGGQCAQ